MAFPTSCHPPRLLRRARRGERELVPFRPDFPQLLPRVSAAPSLLSRKPRDLPRRQALSDLRPTWGMTPGTQLQQLAIPRLRFYHG